MQHYTIAALPPHRSAGACLALGNLLTRGSGLIRRESLSNANDPLSPTSRPGRDNQERSVTTRFRNFVFRSPPISPPVESQAQAVTPVAVGWGIPTDGKKAVRDSEGMGVAGGWLVLGLGWLVEEELAKTRLSSRKSSDSETAVDAGSEKDGLSFAAGSRTRSTTSTRASSRRASVSGDQPSMDHSNNSSDVTESTLLKTPCEDDGHSAQAAVAAGRSEHDQLKLFVCCSILVRLKLD
jgi:hypothetical protein